MSKKRITSEDWAKEFQTFMSANSIEPPKQISFGILSRVQSDLDPSSWQVFSKMALIHFIIGSLMLLICPQFGIAVFDGMGLMSLFMHFGETVCTVSCGAIFLGASTLMASLILKPEEIKKIRKTELLQLSGLSFLSLGVFIYLGATIVVTLGVAWIFGSIAGGLATFELGWLVRSYFRRRLSC